MISDRMIRSETNLGAGVRMLILRNMRVPHPRLTPGGRSAPGGYMESINVYAVYRSSGFEKFLPVGLDKQMKKSNAKNEKNASKKSGDEKFFRN